MLLHRYNKYTKNFVKLLITIHIALFTSEMDFGVVPQHPPTMLAPAFTQSIAYSAKRSGSIASVLTHPPSSSA